MSFVFGPRSLTLLATVQKPLRLVMEKAIKVTPVDFAIIQGLRTKQAQQILYGQGRTAAECRAKGVPVNYARPDLAKVTWTLNSNHMSGRAIDFAPYVNGRIVLPPRPTAAEIELFRKIASACKEAAMELCTPIVWGGDWEGNKDYPHIEVKRGT